MNSTERFRIVMNILDKNDLCNNTTNHNRFEKLKDEDLTDENKIQIIVSEIKTYGNYLENNNNKYSEDVMQALRQRWHLDKYDISRDKEFNEINPHDVFKEVCEWHGLLGGWDWTIKEWIENIFKVKLTDNIA